MTEKAEDHRGRAYKIGRQVGINQATAEIMRLLEEGRTGADGLWSVVERLNEMASGSKRAGEAEEPTEELDLSEADLVEGGEESADEGAEAPAPSDASKPAGEALTLGYSDGAKGGSERRLFLLGEVVEPRARVELLLSKERWLHGTLDWTEQAKDQPSFHLELGGEWEGATATPEEVPLLPTVTVPKVSFTLPKASILRWPEGQS